MVMAKGMASIGTIAVGEKNVKIVLAISKKDFFRNAKFFEGAPAEIEFVLGDMQMNLSDYFDEEAEAAREDARRAAWLLNQPSRLATVDGHGVVQKIDGQAELVQQSVEGNTKDDTGGGEQVANSDEFVQETTENDQDQAESVQDTDVAGKTGDDTELLQSLETDESKGESEPVAAVEPTKEDVELYIMSQKPKFDDINFDPEILVEKKEKNLTWIEIARDRGINSSDLQANLGKYRKRVAEFMKQNGAA